MAKNIYEFSDTLPDRTTRGKTIGEPVEERSLELWEIGPEECGLVVKIYRKGE